MLLALAKHRYLCDGLPVDEDPSRHRSGCTVHRGIGYLFGDRRVTTLAGLISTGLSRPMQIALEDSLIVAWGAVARNGAKGVSDGVCRQ